MQEILNVANIWSDFIIIILHVALLSAVVVCNCVQQAVILK